METYRSILLAGRTAAFFRKPGMLHRLVYHQEQLIRQSAWLARREARVRHVNYDDLVARPEQVCRQLCEFLGVPFDPAMLDLAGADFSAVYDVPHHDYLRSGVIEKRRFSGEILPPALEQKLERFHQRWQRAFGRPLAALAAPAGRPEPALAEVLFHRTLGLALHLGGNAKRLAFELLPLTWLRTYRLFKDWLAAGAAVKTEPTSIAREFRENRTTVVASLLLMAGVVWFDFVTGPTVSVGPLYLLPCGALALIVGLRWATASVFLTAISITVFRDAAQKHFHLPLTGVVLWNFSMRFIFFEIFVLLLNRIRLEIFRTESGRNGLGLTAGGSPE